MPAESSSGGGAALGAVGAAIGAIGSAYGSYEAGQMQKSANEFNAAIAAKQAEVTRAAAKITEYKKRQQIDIAIGEQQTAYAASGVVAVTGSALDVMVSSLSNAYLDLALDRYNTEVAARGLQAQAVSDSISGTMAAVRGTTQAATTLASGLSTYASDMLSSHQSTQDMINARNATFPPAEG